mgnify:CR=1 FL=1
MHMVCPQQDVGRLVGAVDGAESQGVGVVVTHGVDDLHTQMIM